MLFLTKICGWARASYHGSQRYPGEIAYDTARVCAEPGSEFGLDYEGRAHANGAKKGARRIPAPFRDCEIASLMAIFSARPSASPVFTGQCGSALPFYRFVTW